MSNVFISYEHQVREFVDRLSQDLPEATCLCEIGQYHRCARLRTTCSW
jgi:hypothetical protein